MDDAATIPDIKLSDSWKAALRDEFAKPYMGRLRDFLKERREAGHRVFPKGSEYFRALDLTPLENVRVVILGQDPYHGEGQAHGLSFSVKPGVKIPPSLVNIYKELNADLGIAPAPHGFLEHWARQGVLLLNAVLTVEMGQAAAHQGKGWELFTDAVIKAVNDQPYPVVFILWGAYAQKKAAFVDPSRHLVIKSAHPSPCRRTTAFSAARRSRKPIIFSNPKGMRRSTGACPPPECLSRISSLRRLRLRGDTHRRPC